MPSVRTCVRPCPFSQAMESGKAGGGLSGTVGCNGKHEQLLGKPPGSVYRSLWEENMRQQDDDQECAPTPTLQRQTTTASGMFDVLKQSIASLKISGQRKQAIMDTVATLEADSKQMKQTLEASTLEATLANRAANAATATWAATDDGVSDANSSAAVDTAALVRTLTGIRASTPKATTHRYGVSAKARQHRHVDSTTPMAALRRTRTSAT
jgi:hypothetical protein